ncbi:oxidoreductase [Enterobacter sp. Cy-643]|uniref:Gfo/Idh/MocA family oxidoreductase n=1 Tax=Enterobacter sp. Cy-643 TaxID=2608346 RepID=UPI001420A671|nr:Gfo/Idh/MocA family oxidoreductase [Enterobacter sp. Cy-643]NIF32303.1 oxidoreductase [Enterobacter sp. Cy-643]
MQIGFIGVGSVIETAYLPAIQRLSRRDVVCYGFDPAPRYRSDAITLLPSLSQLLALPLDMVFITTSSLQHWPMLKQVLQQSSLPVVVEKPIAATLQQLDELTSLLTDPAIAARVLALDHWMVRTDAARFIDRLDDIDRIEGFLLEPSEFNAAGEPIALNFATGEPDTRKLRHPDGVIVDIGTHVLAMMRETLVQAGADETLNLELLLAKDRLGNNILPGDVTTAEGQALLRGEMGGIPCVLQLNKYAGPAGGQKGINIVLKDGRVIAVDRRGADETLSIDDEVKRDISGPLYDRCLGEVIFAGKTLFEQAPEAIPALTRRRIQEVRALLTLQQTLRGEH